jgi:hypothetical protein
LTNLELENLKNASLLNSKKFRRKIIEVEKKKLVEENEYQRNLWQLQACWRLIRNKGRVWTQLVLRKG